MAGAVKVLLECIGEDPSRGGLLDTPMRVAKALTFMTKGYQQTAQGMYAICRHDCSTPLLTEHRGDRNRRVR